MNAVNEETLYEYFVRKLGWRFTARLPFSSFSGSNAGGVALSSCRLMPRPVARAAGGGLDVLARLFLESLSGGFSCSSKSESWS